MSAVTVAVDEEMTDDGLAGPYGGYRLQPAHYEPARVPPEVARYSQALDSLPVGSPGKVGVLQLAFALCGDQTQLVHHYQKSPLQIMRPLYFDPLRPDMPLTSLMSTGGGVLQGDRLRTDLEFGPGSSAHVSTQTHAKYYRMEQDYAAVSVNLTLEAGAFVEYLPDPVIPFEDSRTYQHTRAWVDEGATLIASDTVYAGRLAHGERHRYEIFASDFEVRRPGGDLVALDRVRLSRDGVSGLAVLADRDVLAMLYVVTPLLPAQEVADRLHEVLTVLADDDLLFGVSVLPYDAGVSLRMVGNDTIAVASAHAAAWAAVHEQLTGRAAPSMRKN
ncbi:urease accessory protein [Sanguibacter gelidistatuariae]|uniref:Urease accessory protein UreD n=1 Tax=Sanguibacter gelidistatuariae TaxID=1814289 RepID=A0A1G6J7C7_9MICO|nr:urease accessory protein UreD [Sanguibacter gelidistatuariae]SDC14621.1 urease accessory protein [Sanguibacter gelidistatuariae]